MGGLQVMLPLLHVGEAKPLLSEMLSSFGLKLVSMGGGKST